MKRLLCIASSLNAGGAETFIMKIYRKLDISNYAIDFIVSETEKGFYADEVQSYGGRIYYVPQRTGNMVKAFFLIKDIVNNGQYNSVLKLCSTPIGSVDLLAAKMGGAKKRICRSCNASTVGGSLSKLKDWVFRFLVKSVTNVFIAPSDLAAKYMFGESKMNNGDVVFLRNGIDLSVYSFSEENRTKYRKMLGMDKSILVGHIGRFNTQKNHKYIIEVFKEILRFKPDSKLVLVGNGNLQTDIEEEVKKYSIDKNVVFLGLRNDVEKLMSALDVIVFPSLFEGMPNVIIEAQATGLPCVLSNTITKEADVTGLLKYLPIDNDYDTWARTVIESAKQNRMLNANQIMRNAGYDINSVTKQFVEICY